MAITPVQDRTITRQVQSSIAGRGVGSPCRVDVQVNKGEVTLNGTVQYTHQKSAAVQAASSVAGVRRVVDRLTVKAVVRY
jgi:osmotically-inducible protein OsmY